MIIIANIYGPLAMSCAVFSELFIYQFEYQNNATRLGIVFLHFANEEIEPQ